MQLESLSKARHLRKQRAELSRQAHAVLDNAALSVEERNRQFEAYMADIERMKTAIDRYESAGDAEEETSVVAYSPARVAKALRIPVNTLRTWAQRGYSISGPISRETGRWRKYTITEVAELAAFKELSASIELSKAHSAISHIATRESSWLSAVYQARRQPGHMYIGMVRHLGTPEVSYGFYTGDRLNAFLSTIAQPREAGSQDGEYGGAVYPVKSVTVIDVGPDVAAAVCRLLSAEGEC